MGSQTIAASNFKTRWKGKSERQVSVAMKKLAKRKAVGMSSRDRKAHAQKMIEARGHWEVGVNGKRKYVWHKKG